MPTPTFRYDPAGLEITAEPERFATFVDALDTLTLANLTDRLGDVYGERTAFILETPLSPPRASPPPRRRCCTTSAWPPASGSRSARGIAWSWPSPSGRWCARARSQCR